MRMRRYVFSSLVTLAFSISSYALCYASPFAYVPNTLDDTVSVIDLQNNQVVDTISVIFHAAGPSGGVAVNSDGSRIYVTTYNNGLVVINGSTNKVIAFIPEGSYPYNIVVHPDDSKVYVGTTGEGSILVIDATTNTPVKDILIGQRVYGMTLTPDGSKLYALTTTTATDPFKTDIVVISTITNQVIQTFRLIDASLESAIAMHPDGSTAYVAMGARNSIAIIDTSTDTLRGFIPISMGVDNLAVHPDGSKIYATSSGNAQLDDQLIIVDATTLTQIASVKIPSPATFGTSRPEGISIHPDGSKIYIVNANDDDVVVLDANTNSLIGFIPVGHSPQAIGQFIKPAAKAGGGRIATLENPAPGSFQSGIGLISGWICNATRVEVDVDGRATLQAAYGTRRTDTQSACSDTDNGFGLLVNWNLLGNGSHRVRILADGVEVASSSFTVTTLELGEFPRGLSGMFPLQDFPQGGRTTRVQWQESTQNFVITNASGSGSGGGTNNPGTFLENPAPGSFQSGIGLISGWICNANRVEIDVDGRATLQAAYGTGRNDTQSACGDTNNGYGLLVNWNLLGDGVHRVRILADGVEVGSATFTVATLGLGEFPRGLKGAYLLPNFPQTGKSTRVQWQESGQNFVITGVQ